MLGPNFDFSLDARLQNEMGMVSRKKMDEDEYGREGRVVIDRS